MPLHRSKLEFDEIVWQEEIAAKVAGTPITALLVIAYYEIFRKFDTRYPMYNIIVVFILVRVWKKIKEEHFDKDMRIFFKEAKSKEVLKEEKNAREIYDALSLLSYEHMDKSTVMYEKDIAGIFELFAREKVEEKEAAAEVEQWLKQLKEDHLLISAGADGVTSVGFAPDGKTVLSGSYDNTLKLWDIRTGRCIKTIPLLWIPRDIKAMPGKPGIFATANANGTVTLFDLREVLGVSGEW